MQALANGRGGGIEGTEPGAAWQLLQAARTSGGGMDAMLAGVCQSQA